MSDATGDRRCAPGTGARPGSRPAPERPPPVRLLSSATLFAGAVEVAIEHGGERYRLRRTSKGKLILTK